MRLETLAASKRGVVGQRGKYVLDHLEEIRVVDFRETASSRVGSFFSSMPSLMDVALARAGVRPDFKREDVEPNYRFSIDFYGVDKGLIPAHVRMIEKSTGCKVKVGSINENVEAPKESSATLGNKIALVEKLKAEA
jgi:hypothetical protein